MTTVADPVMVRVRRLFSESGWTMHQLGLRMGYGACARQSVYQFLKTDDPRISMLRRFAQAFDVPLSHLIDGPPQ